MTFRIERVHSLFRAATTVAWLAGFAACTADNVLGSDTGNGTPAIQYFALSYDPITDQLVVGTDRGVKLFQAGDGRKLHTIGDGLALLARRAGGVIAASDYESARIFDDGGNLLRTIVHPREGVFDLDLSPDGSMIAATFTTGRVRFVDTATGAEIKVPLQWPPETPAIYNLRFSPDGGYLASASPGTRIWRLDDGAIWADIPGLGDSIAFSSAGEIARVTDTAVDVFAVPSGNKLASYATGGFWWPILAYSVDGTRLAFNAPEGKYPDTVVNVIDRVSGTETVKMVDDPQTRPPEAPCCKPRAIVALTFAGPDHIAVAWDDGRLAAFRFSDGALVWSRLDSD
jgi:WD40 repeat protein